METDGLGIGESAEVLGVHPFTLLARAQMDELALVRDNAGEMRVPQEELIRLGEGHTGNHTTTESQRVPTDQELGVTRGLFRKGQRTYHVPGYTKSLSAAEIVAYRKAYAAIGGELELLTDLRQQLRNPNRVTPVGETFVEVPHEGRWNVRGTLLNLGRSDILLCERGDELAVIEKFQPNSTYARTRGTAEILLTGRDAQQLVREFKENAQLTLEFMASNLTAKAQRIIWNEQQAEHPAHVVAAISERCRNAVQETETQTQRQTAARGIRI